MTPLDQITHLTFDCYGTLIDWEDGILTVAQPLLTRLDARIGPEAILRSYVKHEARLEAGGWKPYREILRDVMAGIAGDLDVSLSGDEADTLVNSLPDWPPFPDTVGSLQKLAAR